MSTSSYSRLIELQPLETEPISKSGGNEDTAYDPGKHPAQHPTTRRSRFSGWRGGVLLSVLVVLCVLLLNVILAIIITTVWKAEGGIATAFTGDCKKAAGWTTAIHLLINLLSSLLLGASNYCMQRLVSPTRMEIDHAHAQKKWLDIGTPSVRNLGSISKWRTALWVMLGLSSAPLHFVYNSVVFETIAANNVDFLTVAPEFFTDKNSWSLQQDTKILNATTDNFVTQLQNLLLDGKYLNQALFENLTNSECVARYSASFITEAGAGFGVPDAHSRQAAGLNASQSLARTDSGSGDLDVSPFVGDSQYSYCLSQIVAPKCQVQFSRTILLIVITCNVIKVTLMSIVLWRLNQETIVTIGDAIKSFLERPDPWTDDYCLLSRRNVDTLWKSPELRANQRYQPRSREPWFGACSVRRWIFSVLLYIAVIVVASSLLGVINKDTRSKGRNGFGRVNVEYLIDINLPFSEDSILPFVLLANLPQAVISFIYIVYNGLFTTMLCGREWARYAIKRASLRVTIPGPGQRSTYFLQLPYMWSIPLLVASILLHWFVSQSIFLARIAIYKNGVPVSAFNDRLTMYRHLSSSGSVFSGVGYSDAALLASIGWGSALVGICLLVAGICTYPEGLPLGGTNSAVISAACHMRYEDNSRDILEENAAEKPVKWGVTIRGEMDKVGHCCFSSQDVESPRPGCLYAGLRRKKYH